MPVRGLSLAALPFRPYASGPRSPVLIGALGEAPKPKNSVDARENFGSDDPINQALHRMTTGIL